MRAGTAPVVEHGTVNTYQRHLCRCEACCEAQAAYKRSYRGRCGARHGTRTRYVYGPCRCDKCREAYSEYMKRWRRAKHCRPRGRGRPRLERPFPMQPLLELVRARCGKDGGDGYRGLVSPLVVIAELARVDRRTVHRWRHEGLTLEVADDVAVRLGFHPSEVWPDWWRG